MEKILLAIDSTNIDPNALDFACELTRLTRSKLNGILIEEPVTEEAVVNSPQAVYVESILKKYGYQQENMINTKEENIQLFKDKTEEAGIRAVLEANCEVTSACITGKTRFADILIVDAATSFAGFNEKVPTSFVKDILQNAECPVIIAPEEFNGIDNVVFCYDGSKSSVFAIKQFTYLFPELRDKRAKVIYLGQDDFVEEDQVAIVDWLSYHYNDVEFIALEGNAIEAFFHYLTQKKNDFVVMGAYGRGLLESFFNRDGFPEPSSLPVFVSHY